MIHGPGEMLPRVSAVEVGSNYDLILTFTNGERKLYNAEHLLKFPMYKNLAKVFKAARVAYGTVVWPGDMDISPDTLYLRGTAIND